MGDMYRVVRSDELMHYGRKGMKWGMNIFEKDKTFSIRKKKPKSEKEQVEDYSKRLKKMVKKVSKESEKMGGEIRGKKIVNYDHPKFKEANKYLKDSAIKYSKTKEFDRLAKQYMDSFDKYGLPKNVEATRKLNSQITDNIRNLAAQNHAKELLALDMKYSGYDTNKKNVNDIYEAWNKHAPYSVEEIVKESNYTVSSGNKNIANNAVRVAFEEWRKRNEGRAYVEERKKNKR